MSLKNKLSQIMADPWQHAKWLNTLSYLENCGAKLMAGCEHPTLVKEEMLKHAAEEFRHAYVLKNQIAKVHPDGIDTYRVDTLLGGYSSLQYLTKLNVGVSRLLKRLSYKNLNLRGAAYTLVSYAIEVRAHDVYPTYQELLLEAKSRVSVRTIILEEAEHLQEMQEAVSQMPNGAVLAEKACQIEQALWHSLQLQL
ncbi:MAG: hypothetical protein Q8K75_04795 [Chlamydiales bacterium]|nr:hypothetical protein [Chlamydiales bacterium]